MSLLVPAIDPVLIVNTANALNDWLPCPYTRQALLSWVEASLAMWALTRQISPELTDEFVSHMSRMQYREWIEEAEISI